MYIFFNIIHVLGPRGSRLKKKKTKKKTHQAWVMYTYLPTHVHQVGTLSLDVDIFHCRTTKYQIQSIFEKKIK